MCRGSNHPFGKCAQLETAGHNPRTVYHGSSLAFSNGRLRTAGRPNGRERHIYRSQYSERARFQRLAFSLLLFGALDPRNRLNLAAAKIQGAAIPPLLPDNRIRPMLTTDQIRVRSLPGMESCSRRCPSPGSTPPAHLLVAQLRLTTIYSSSLRANYHVSTSCERVYVQESKEQTFLFQQRPSDL